MKTIEALCDELRSIEGAIGAFVFHEDKCIGSSLPESYDIHRLEQVGSGLSRLRQLSHKAGYVRAYAALHWARASLYSWPLGDASVLGVLTHPGVQPGVLELSAAMAAEDLTALLALATGPRTSAPPPMAATRPTTPPSVAAAAVLPSPANSPRLERLEALLIEELGPGGRSLLRRAVQESVRPGTSEDEWLLRLRANLLAEVADRSAWAAVATSILWLPSTIPPS